MWDIDLRLNKVYNVIPELFDCDINKKDIYTVLSNGKISKLNSVAGCHKGHFIVIKKLKSKLNWKYFFKKRNICEVLIKCEIGRAHV